jgi:mannose-6-phosphate isomerase-like protein (cupin superfamily)
MKAIILAAALCAGATAAAAQTQGVATDILKGDVEALAKTMLNIPGGDQLLRVVPINNGEYNTGVAVVHRAPAQNIAASLSHTQITEIYYVLRGSGMMVSGGTMENAKDQTPVNPVIGPSLAGGKITGGAVRKIGAGDIVIVPPNTPHGWTEVNEELVYLTFRMDPKKVLPLK